MSDRAIRSIAVVGAGIVGLSAAVAFRRTLPNVDLRIVEVTPDPAALADRMPLAWPSVNLFHALVGIDERDLLRRAIAVHHVGTVFTGWPEGRSWIHAFGPHGRPVGAVSFDQIWVRAQRAGKARPYEAYSPADVLARASKFVHPPRDPDSPVAEVQYGLRLDPDLYRERLRESAAASRIGITTADIAGVERYADRNIAALVLNNGERVQADLFIDCAGSAAWLIREVDASFEEWPSCSSNSLVIDDVDVEAATPVARVSRTVEGWTAEWPLPGRTIRCGVGSGEGAVAIRPGRRVRAWAGNVLAVGDAAVAIDPLYGLNLALMHRAIFLALELLPGRDFNPVELAEFNRRWGLITDQVRDLTALLHGCAEGFTGELPESLARRLDQFEHRGRFPFQEDEVLNRDDWTSALLGMGMVPQNVDPAASGVPLDRAVEAMNKLADEFAAFASRAPTYPDYLARITRDR